MNEDAREVPADDTYLLQQCVALESQHHDLALSLAGWPPPHRHTAGGEVEVPRERLQAALGLRKVCPVYDLIIQVCITRLGTGGSSLVHLRDVWAAAERPRVFPKVLCRPLVQGLLAGRHRAAGAEAVYQLSAGCGAQVRPELRLHRAAVAVIPRAEGEHAHEPLFPLRTRLLGPGLLLGPRG